LISALSKNEKSSKKDFDKYFNLRFSSVPRPVIKLKSRYPGVSYLPDEYGDVPHKKQKGRGQANAMNLYL
jgi:hypothetical protein